MRRPAQLAPAAAPSCALPGSLSHSIALVAIRPVDLAFLSRDYASTREKELCVVPGTPEEKDWPPLLFVDLGA